MSIIGIGEDGIDGLGAAAKNLLQSAEHVIGGQRHLDHARPLIKGREQVWSSPMTVTLDGITDRRFQKVVVLASGDPFHYGVGRLLAARVPLDELLCIPQPSSFSLAAARLGWSLQDTALATLNGRALEGLVRHLHDGAKILALSWDDKTPAKAAELLRTRGFSKSTITVLEHLSGERERITQATANAFDVQDISPLNVIAIEAIAEPAARIIAHAPGLPDDYFEHDGQITKREMRAVTLSALSPRNNELLWDIGLGAGSVAIEWLLCRPSLRAIGFEKNPERADRAQRNAIALGAPELKVVTGAAPESLSNQDQPDVIFIGGGLTTTGLFDTAWQALKPGGRLVANAVTLESEKELIDLHAVHGGELTRVGLAHAEKVGTRHGWRPAMPVIQWRVEKP